MSTGSNSSPARKRRGSLAVKIRWSLLAFTIALLVAVTAALTYWSYQAQQQTLHLSQQKTAERVSQSVSSYLQATIREMLLFEHVQNLTALNSQEQQEAMEDLLSYRGDVFDELALLDNAGTEVVKVSEYRTYTAGDLVSQAHTPEFEAAIRGDNFIGPVYLSEYSLPMATVSVPVQDEYGRVAGALLAQVSVRQMWKVVTEVGLGESGYTYIVDQDGSLLAHKTLATFFAHRGTDLSSLPAVKAALTEGSEQAPGTYVDFTGERVTSAHAPITVENIQWIAVVAVPVNEAYATIYNMLIALGLILVAALALSGVVGTLISRTITRPLSLLEEGASVIGAGDLDHRIEIETEDEVGALASSFNTMAERIGNLLQGLEERGDELAARTREIEASQRVTFAASERTSPDRLLNLVVNLIRDQFHLYHVQVYIVAPPFTSPPQAGGTEEGRAAVLRQSTGYAGRILLQRKHRIPLDQPALVTKAIHNKEPVLVADVRQSPDFLPNPLLPDTQSELAVPLKVGDDVIGVLDAQSREAGRFTQETVALFQTMADQVAFLFENSDLLARVTEQTQALTVFTGQLRAAADIARQMGGTLDPQQLLQQAVDLIRDRFGFYHVHIYILDETDHGGRGQLIVQAGSGEVGRLLRERGHSIPLDTKRSLVARAARDRETLLVEDTSLESDFMPNPLLPQTRSSMSAPLVAGDRVLGVLNIQDDQPGRFTEIELDTLSSLAGQIATALQNAAYFEEIQQAAEQLRQMDRLKSEFLANMSHELRTPLNSIIGYAELMLMGVSDIDPDTLEDVQAIYDNGRNLLTMVNDILDMAKIEAGSLTLNLEQVPIAPLIAEVSARAVKLLEGKPIEWIVEVEPDLPPIQADPLRIGQILDNLVTNAEKFTAQGAISLRAYADAGRVCIEIRDTGIGIAESDMDKVFDRFQQVDSSSTRRAGGAGLGLAITRHLVELHGGTIEVESQPGEGSTFTVRLPVEVGK